MSKPLSAAIAWRYLRSKKSHSAVGAISTVSICGMAVATAAIICVLSVFNGFMAAISERLDTLSPDVIVTPAKGKVFAEAEQLAAKVAKIKGVETATPTLTDNALAICDSREMPVTLKGVDREAYRRVTAVESLIKPDEGSYFSTGKGDGTTPQGIISIGTASQLEALPQSTILLFAPRREGRINPANPASSFLTDSVYVPGVYRSEQSEYDQNGIIVDLATARDLLQYSSEASAIEVKGTPGTDDASLTAAIASALGPDYVVKDRLRQQEMNFRMISIEKWVSFLLLFFILMIASFNIISTLSMLVLEKQNSMSTLTAMGMPAGRIGSIFAWESIYVSLIGGLSGILLGLALCLLQQHFGFITLPGAPGATYLRAYPVEVHFSDVALTLLPVAVIGAATALITARFAKSRIK